MKSDIVNPKHLFQKNVRYLIPMFQRPYVWNQEDQWEPLWDDVRNVAERYLDNLQELGSDQSAEAERKTKAHFLGAVVLQHVQTATVDIEQRHVIDGQQRLTTLQLLLDAVQEVAADLQLRPEAKRLSKLVLNDEDLVVDEDHIFKIWPTSLDQSAFRHAMHNGLATSAYEASAIVQAHEFFQLQTREWLTADSDSTQARANALETAITGLLRLVVIDLEVQDDPNVIFETLNARGTPLIQSDLVKNFILYELAPEPTDQEEVYADYWQHFDNDWWREEVQQGRLIRPRIDVYINYWLSMRTVSEVLANKVFDRFGDYARAGGTLDISSDLKRVLGHYRTYASSDLADPKEERFRYRTQVMQAGVITPVLLLLLSADPGILPPGRRTNAMRAIESFLVRRMVCRGTTKDYNRLMLDLAEALQQQGLEEADRIVVEYLAGQTADSRQWPSDRAISSAFASLPLYRLLTRGRLRIVLEAIEESLRTTKAEVQSVPRNLTIEHVMPQSWRESWPLPSGVDEISASEERNNLVHSIGNLTLVNESLNPALSNAPWEQKSETLSQHSVLFLNKVLLEEHAGANWDEQKIIERSESLSKKFASVWPGPDWSLWEGQLP